MNRILQLFIMACAFWASACWSASYFPDRYDAQIKGAASHYLPGEDWRLLKAQYYQESLLNPEAVSPVGAEGIAQFMPGTWLDISRELNQQQANPRMVKPAILAGAYYMGKLKRIWTAERTPADRYSLALASYNAGAGSLIKAQKKCKGVNHYAGIVHCLPDVTGKYSTETITYVRKIWGHWVAMLVSA